MTLSHKRAIALSGLIWIVIGFSLLMRSTQIISSAYSTEQAPLLLICIGFILGFLKGRLVLAKTAGKSIDRIISASDPAPISTVFPLRYLAIIVLMMGMGFVAKLLPTQVRIVVCIAVGSGLINGGMHYFRYLMMQKTASPRKR